MEQMSMFENSVPQPLAARLRPQTLEDYVGQEHLLGKGRVLRNLIESDQISSYFQNLSTYEDASAADNLYFSISLDKVWYFVVHRLSFL